ncbi:MFS transporter [Actinoplanes sp. HUAS TT8]|uniref:MFS transporter n=1 Tax=Actinoplanes sp. HUAS TT8 TaxID=3447453 RepID=UPI003F51F1BB
MRAWITIAALALSTFLYVTIENLPIGLLPQLAHGLGVSDGAAGLLVTAYGLVVVITTVPLTRVSHRFGRRRLITFLLVVAVGGTVVSALAPTYPVLLGSRIAVAMSQAVFWAVITPAAAAMVEPAQRGRALSVLYGGSSLAPLLGIPAGTWLGQQTSWRVAFFALAGIGLAVLVVVAALMPEVPPGGSDADRGTAPDRARFRVLLVTVALLVTGSFTAFTYVNQFLTEVSGVGEAAIGPVLFVRGVAGLAGVLLAGWVAARYTWVALITVVAVQAVALAGQFLFGGDTAVAVVAVSLAGAALAGSTVLQAGLILRIAPGRTDAASAANSTAFNVGITAGAALASVLVGGTGARGPVLAGAAVTALALVSAVIRTGHGGSEPRPAAPVRAAKAQADATRARGGRDQSESQGDQDEGRGGRNVNAYNPLRPAA